jgi:poly(hydroxyalkanoate) depolymerase family esterase
MASILDTVWGTGPQRARRQSQGPGARPAPGGNQRRSNRLTEIDRFGADPGALRMLTYAPKNLAPGSPLVVVLHGCSQTAEGYDAHSGWSALADELGFALLYPEQRRGNNLAGCFNWFHPADTARGLGEARSIREMIETLVAKRRLDRGRIFVTGLSAGGAMSAHLLAAYPEVFSAGAVIAGLPCGAAATVKEAFEVMAKPTTLGDSELGDAVRAGAPYGGPWPRVSIWQGLSDRTVAPGNADLLVRQWVDVHGAEAAPALDEKSGQRRRRVWRFEGRDVVEAQTIEGLGHGTPLDGRRGERPGPFMLDVGVSSTREIAAFFGLGTSVSQAVVDDETTATAAAAPSAGKAARIETTPRRKTMSGPDAAPVGDGARRGPVKPSIDTASPWDPDSGRLDVAGVITKALKAAGLMR